MPAPALQVGEWLKGSPVKEFNKDSTYVMEFWATWCAPCKAAMPHLSELAKQYPKIKIIGVSVWELNTNNVKPFVEGAGEKMSYTVAIDLQDSATAQQGYMTNNWLKAADLNGIPATFVVNNNQVVWIGHPMALDSVLKSVSAGNWNTEAFAKQWTKERADEAALNARLEEFSQRLTEYANGNKKKFYQTLDEQFKYVTSLPGGWPMVNDHIWNWVADPEGTLLTRQMKDFAFAIKWMEKLVAQPGGEDPAFFDTLAWCYYGAGKKQKAIEIESRALALLPRDHEGRAEFEKALKIFRE